MLGGRLATAAYLLTASALAAAGCSDPNGSGDGAASPDAAALSAPSETADSGHRCQAAELRITVAGHDDPGGGQVHQTIDLTNTRRQPCTMTGFPGVDLLGAATDLDIAPDGTVTVGAVDPNRQWSLTRQSADHGTVTLAPDATAHFVLTYLPGDPGADPASMARGLSVHHLLVTPPDDTEHATIAWTVTVALQDEATHPGTYVGPILPGA
ncbi:DUF4232 domain-containing protein [Nocardia aurantia]|uniref:DUF4232 domain-containing protein n=1 Tax=Nocardia aurantia TaxID=2585199 RepID=A0A7K0DYW6_9NOCA|nr:DUF4232 domain-containing protein [Nocardia aurantia]MQY30717.1 hypothetical protein [Nocardia aurantia]